MNYILDFGRITEDEKVKVNDIIYNHLRPKKIVVVEEVVDPIVSYPEVLINDDNSHYIQNMSFIESTNWSNRNRRNNQPNSHLNNGNLSDLIENTSQFIGPIQFQNDNDDNDDIDYDIDDVNDNDDNDLNNNSFIGPLQNHDNDDNDDLNNSSFIGPLQDEVDIFINQYFDEDDNYIGPVRENK